MSMGEAMDNASNACAGARCGGAREVLVFAMLVYGLAHGSELLAEDQSADVAKNMPPIVGGKPLPTAFLLPSRAIQTESSTGFVRRGSDDGPAAPTNDVESSFTSQPLQTAPRWQRLADYRAQGRVQLLTLWASPRNMVSLQAGKHGGPSLQWSSRAMNRGGATRGLLDRLVASSLGVAGFGSKMTRNPSASAGKTTGSIAASKSP